MKERNNNIFTIYDEILQRSDKEKLLNQKAVCIWMTGLSGSGKTTLAKILEKKLAEKSFLTILLDGDNVRDGLNNNLGFAETDRQENIRRISEVNKLFINCGIITINCFVSPTEAIRNIAKSIIGSDDFIEIFVDTPLAICESRDVKGLYQKARRGEIKNFTGLDAPFEIPVEAELVLKTENRTAEQTAESLLQFILPKITIQ